MSEHNSTDRLPPRRFYSWPPGTTFRATAGVYGEHLWRLLKHDVWCDERNFGVKLWLIDVETVHDVTFPEAANG